MSTLELVRLATPVLGFITLDELFECGDLEGRERLQVRASVSSLVHWGYLERLGWRTYRRAR